MASVVSSSSSTTPSNKDTKPNIKNELLNDAMLFCEGLKAAFEDEALNEAIKEAALDLEKKGYAVVPGILTSDECTKSLNDFWSILEKASGGRIERPTCAEDWAKFKKGGNWPSEMHGILSNGEWAHLPLVRTMRTHNPRACYVFMRLYGCEVHELKQANDRINFQAPAEWMPHSLKKVPKTQLGIQDASWLHCDQALLKPGRHCIQSLLSLTPATQAGDASLELIPYSHLLHQHLESLVGRKLTPSQAREDWLKFSDEDKQRMADTIGFVDDDGVEHAFFDQFISVKTDPGSLLLWDSRTLHQGGCIRAHSGAPRVDTSRPRFVVYICMQPIWGGVEKLDEKQRKKMQTSFEKRRATSHWPGAGKTPITIFGLPRVYAGQSQSEWFWDGLLDTPNPHEDSLASQFFGLASPLKPGILTRLHRQSKIPKHSHGLEPLLKFHPESGCLRKSGGNEVSSLVQLEADNERRRFLRHFKIDEVDTKAEDADLAAPKVKRFKEADE